MIGTIGTKSETQMRQQVKSHQVKFLHLDGMARLRQQVKHIQSNKAAAKAKQSHNLQPGNIRLRQAARPQSKHIHKEVSLF